MTRLIDADKLKKALSEPLYRSTIKDFGEVIEYTHIMNTIDNAPTVEPCYQTTSCLDCGNYNKENHNCPRFCEVIREIAKENQRPQGEWGDWIIAEIQCPNCFEYFETDCYSTEELNKCPNCGAKMQKCDADMGDNKMISCDNCIHNPVCEWKNYNHDKSKCEYYIPITAIEFKHIKSLGGTDTVEEEC